MTSDTVLAADIGGTHARFMLVRQEGAVLQPLAEATLAVADHPSVDAAAAAFVARFPEFRARRACLAVAGPIEGRTARLTNAPWRIDAEQVAAALGLDAVHLCNDFEAAALGVAELDADQLLPLHDAPADPQGMRVVIGAGTGLGVAYLLPGHPAAGIVAGEGGHATFAPVDDEQARLRDFIVAETTRVSNEHVLSGAGIVRLYAFAAQPQPLPHDVESEGAAAVTRRAEAGEEVAQQALRLFVTIFGGVCGDHALSVLATGGVYVAGGIAPRMPGRFARGEFVDAFCNKGAHRDLMRRMPVALVCEGRLGLLGAARRAMT
jgi:glucokinase